MRRSVVAALVVSGAGLIALGGGCSTGSDGSGDFADETFVGSGETESKVFGDTTRDGRTVDTALGPGATELLGVYQRIISLLAIRVPSGNMIQCTQTTSNGAVFQSSSAEEPLQSLANAFNDVRDTTMRANLCNLWGGGMPGPLRVTVNSLLAEGANGTSGGYVVQNSTVRYGNGTVRDWVAQQKISHFGSDRETAPDGSFLPRRMPLMRLHLLLSSNAINYNGTNSWNTCTWYRDKFGEIVKQLNTISSDGDIQKVANWDSSCGKRDDAGRSWFASPDGTTWTTNGFAAPYSGKTFPSLDFLVDPAFDGTYASSPGTSVGFNSTETTVPPLTSAYKCVDASFANKACRTSDFTIGEPDYVPTFQSLSKKPSGLLSVLLNGTEAGWVAQDSSGNLGWPLRYQYSPGYCANSPGKYRCREECPGGDATKCVQQAGLAPAGMTFQK